MMFEELWKKTKRTLALVLAAALFVGGWTNYDMFVRAAAEFTVTLEAGEAEYTGSTIGLPGIEVKAENLELLEDTDYTVAWTYQGEPISEAEKVGEYTCTVKGQGTYASYPEAMAAFTVLKTLEEGNISLNPESGVYTGEEQKPGVTVEVDGNALVKDTDYEVTYDPNTDFTSVGEHKLTVAGKGNYRGTVEKVFSISYDPGITKGQIQITGAVEVDGIYFFKDSVSIQAAAGYELVDGDITLSDSVQDLKVMVKNTTAGTFGLVEVGTFTKDTDAPVVTPVIEYSGEEYITQENEIWVKEITAADIKAKDGDKGSGVEQVYYTQNAAVTDPAQMDPVQSDLAKKLESGKTYYFCAVDRVGNVSAIVPKTISKFDSVAPVITVRDGAAEISNGATVYLNAAALTDGEKTYDVTADDGNGAGIDPAFWNRETAFTPADETVSEKRTITNSVKDYVQNEGIHSFSVVYDVDAPQITKTQVLVGDTETTEAEILTNKDVTIKAIVTDNEELEKVVLIGAQGGETELTPLAGDPEGYTHSAVISTDSYLNEEYQIAAYDKAGNKAEGAVWTVEIDKEVPKFSETDIQMSTQDYQNAHQGWTNADTEFTVTVANDHANGVEPVLQYKKSTDSAWTELSDGAENPDGKWVFRFTETDETYDEAYEFRMEDTLGNAAGDEDIVSVEFKKDKVDPSADDILVEYKSDGAEETGKEDFISKITQAVSERLFAKTEIEATLYIKDKISGVQTVTCTFGEDNQELAFEVYKDAQAKIDEEGYYIVPVKATVYGDGAGTLKITSITDAAGNTINEASMTAVPEGTRILVVDKTSPKLEVMNPEAQGKEDGEKERLYYSPQGQETEETVELIFAEAFYDKYVDGNGDPVKPVIQILKDGIEDSTILPGDSDWEMGSGQMKVTLKLPYEAGKETEYQITAEYQDGSGNLLEKGDNLSFGKVENGCYTSGTYVLDDKAPELAGYSVNKANARTDAPDEVYTFGEDKVPVYKNDPEKEDLQVTFTLNENLSYIDKGQLIVEVFEKDSKDTPAASTEDGTLTVNRTENTSEYSFGFDGSDNSENEYYVVIRYEDASGNKMISGSSEIQVEEGAYTSGRYILDHTAPVFNISFNDAYQVTDADNVTLEGKTPLEECTSYYGIKEGRIEVTVTITEKYLELTKAQDGNKEITDFSFRVNGKETAMSWTQTGTVYTGTCVVEEDGDYTVEASYQDMAGNKMTDGDAVQGGQVSEGAYESPLLVLDTTAPVLARNYSTKHVNEYEGRKYYNADTMLNISVTDNNIRYKELTDNLDKMTAVDISGKNVDDTAARVLIDGIKANENQVRHNESTPWEVDIPISTEANYTIPVAFTDLAGNKAELAVTELVTADKTAPEALNLDYTIKDPVNYGPFGWLFSQAKMTIKASAADSMGGMQYIRFIVTDENNKKTEETKIFSPAAEGKYEITIPLETADFKGSVEAVAADWSANELRQTRGHVVESADKHSSTSSAEIITVTEPSRRVNGVDFYNTDVAFNLKLSDSYSGIRSFEYTGGSTLQEKGDFAAEAGTDLTQAADKNITYQVDRSLVLKAAENNRNEVKVRADFMDNTRRTGFVEQLYNIDITAPEITVEYDLNSPANEKYYNQTRTATVTIRERNFNENDVEFRITNTDGAMPSISGWSSSGSGDDTKHVCHVTFDEDGDYTFTLSFMDMAGNKADYNRVDEFTIDKTLPELTVTWDNNNSLNGYYYAASRTATIDILEHNFDERLIDVIITAAGDAEGKPALSGWSHNGDHNIARVTFDHDGDYTLDIEGMDLAENLLEDYAMERFIVDQTEPELEIFDIENMSANNGVVRPGIRYSDTNYDAEGTVIVMKGFNNGVVEMNGTESRSATGMEIKLNDFEHVQEMDDMYTMDAAVYDLAGNSSEAQVVFSVNRFGSIYTFDEDTDKLVGADGRYYTNEEQDIVVTETNVDTLEFKEITKNLNGDLQTMKEGENYTVKESGTEVSWKQYTYSMSKDNFEKEGTYILTIYSEDRATNNSDNNTKGKKVEFVVDKTNPSVLISGVENDGQYRENSRQFTLDVEDNIRLARVEVQIDGEKTEFDAAAIEAADGKLTLTAKSANRWQKMSVTAVDAAGNEQKSEEIRFLVTANILVQYFMNKALFFGSLAVLAVLAVGGWRFYVIGKRRKDEEEE